MLPTRLATAAAGLCLVACQQQQPAASNIADPAPAENAASVPRPAAPGLSAYLGRYPVDVVGGRRFLDEPAVRAAVTRLAPSRAVAAQVLSAEATTTPIAEQDGKLVAGGCEPHNCGAHNWAVRIEADGSGAELCYMPDGGSPTWYGADPVGAPKDACPSG